VAYGTSIDEIVQRADEGLVSIHSIFPGPQGAGALRRAFASRAFSIGLLPAAGSMEVQLAELRKRLVERGRDDPATIDTRLKHQPESVQFVLDNPYVDTEEGSLRVFNDVVINEHLSHTLMTVEQLFVTVCGIKRSDNAI
jgi:guanylate kinase